MVSVYPLLGVPTPFDPTRKLVTSPVFSLSVLACIRLTFAIYTSATVMTVLVWEGVEARMAKDFGFFSYFTDLSYIGLCAYFWASGVQTFVSATRGQKEYPLQRWPRIFQTLHVLLHTTITTFPILVTIVYWAVLSDSTTFGTRYSAWSNISQHALNTVFAVVEILLTYAGPQPWSHLPLMVLILASYLGVAYITHATQGYYPYGFLDPAKEHAKLAGYIIGIGVGECVIFVLTHYIMVFRDRLSAGWRPGAGQNQTHAAVGSEDLHEWEQVEFERAMFPVQAEAI